MQYEFLQSHMGEVAQDIRLDQWMSMDKSIDLEGRKSAFKDAQPVDPIYPERCLPLINVPSEESRVLSPGRS